MKSIMFFGDSNTWGYDSATKKRYPDNVRFTGLLRERMKDCYIIEEGLKGRTNSLDDNLSDGRNGFKALPMLLCTHDPIDIFVIMLGTNDTKRTFNQSAYEIAKGLENNVKLAKRPLMWDGTKSPKILIVCPVGVTADYVGDDMEGYFNEHSVAVSKELPDEYRKVAKNFSCEFLNGMEITGPGTRDGVHLDEEGHKKLADALEQKLREML